MPAPERGYRLTSPDGSVAWLGDAMQPTVLLGTSHVVVALNPTLARAAVAAVESPTAGNWGPSGELVETFECLPADLTSLSVADAGKSAWPETIANLPRLVQLVGNYLEARTGDAARAPTAAMLRAFVGIPRPGGFHLRINPAEVPKADALQAQLFPSVLATATDDHGLRFISREAFPLTGSGVKFEYKTNTKEGVTLRLGLNLGSFADIFAEIKEDPKDGGKFSLGLNGHLSLKSGEDE